MQDLKPKALKGFTFDTDMKNSMKYGMMEWRSSQMTNRLKNRMVDVFYSEEEPFYWACTNGRQMDKLEKEVSDYVFTVRTKV